ncbi:MAG: S-adenosylmethionine decarboxylase [Candidatus Omnitrophica bacterium]|nr:S-adenosylmethionine decarboxylase [Candidatus Omnitrophota bacterium]
MGTKHYLISSQENYSGVGLASRPLSTNDTTLSSSKIKKPIFGYELILDLSGCDLSIMSSKKKLTEYVNTLCKLIKMKKYGKAQLPYFGLDKPFTKGYSLLQFIETSSITGHFSEHWQKSYINIFSCKKYDHELAKNFTKEFFKATSIKSTFLVR